MHATRGHILCPCVAAAALPASGFSALKREHLRPNADSKHCDSRVRSWGTGLGPGNAQSNLGVQVVPLYLRMYNGRILVARHAAKFRAGPDAARNSAESATADSRSDASLAWPSVRKTSTLGTLADTGLQGWGGAGRPEFTIPACLLNPDPTQHGVYRPQPGGGLQQRVLDGCESSPRPRVPARVPAHGVGGRTAPSVLRLF